jgi:succinylglutamate desuccinylase
LLDLAGQRAEPLFVSILLHGNEPAGLKAVQLLLTKYQNKVLPRSLAIFVGNIAAAKAKVRRLDNQPDYNRIWPGTETDECAETELAQDIFDIMKQRRVFASIDIHNNTGLNPHYACINRLEAPFLELAALFGRLVVYFLRPKGVQSAAFATLCPSVTLECGRPDQPQGIAHALDYLETCLHLPELPQHRIRPADIDLFHTVAQVKIPDHVTFSFDDTDSHLLLNKDIEQFNFTEIPSGTVMGKVNGNHTLPIAALDENGMDVTAKFFLIDNSEVQMARPTMPSMLTLNEGVIRQDCLCYLMERMNLSIT